MYNEYVNFEIRIEDSSILGSYSVFAKAAPDAEAAGDLRLNPADSGFQQLLNDALISTPAEGEQTRERLGQILFNALFDSSIKQLFGDTLDDLAEDQGLRLVLNIKAPEISALPWELLSDPNRGPLALLDIPIMRFVPQELPIRPLAVSGPYQGIVVRRQATGLRSSSVAVNGG